MKRLTESDFLQRHFWRGWRRVALVFLCVLVLLMLGIVRRSTDAEFAFASLALLPVLAVAWIGGRVPGMSMAAIATAMWVVAEMTSDHQYSVAWIPWVNAVVRMALYGTVVLLATQVRTQLERERKHATCDALTGLNNRRHFLAAGAVEVERAKRYGNPVTVLFLDLDNFKTINDTQGHSAGDATLQATANALKQATRESDIVCRLGGDEFAVVLPAIGHGEALAASRKILNAVNTALQAFPPVRASMGAAWFEAPDMPFESMLNDADHMMYSVKAAGKNDLLFKRHSKAGM